MSVLLRGVGVAAGNTTILQGMDFEVARGRIVAVVGPNGAGKTTLLDAISGTVPGITGTVEIDGAPRPTKPGVPRAGVGRVFQGSPLPETMTAGEVLALVAGGRRAAAPVLERFGLTAHETSFVAELSTGMRRILDLAVASIGRPAVLLLDEPASGLAQSEIEHLAEVLLRLREQTDACVVLVEHDAWLVKAVADEIVVLDDGEIVARGTPDEVMAAEHVRAQPRMRAPRDERFTDALGRVEATSVPAPPLIRRSLSTWTIARLGLREFAAGLGSVLILGVLSRVLKVELGIGLYAVGAILATYNLAAPLGLPIGHWSDTRPIRGRRRVPYILGGATIAGLAVALAPHVAGGFVGGLSLGAIVLAVGLFVLMGIGMYGAGTAYFALISDIAGPAERGHVAKVIYLELLAGVFLGVALTGALVEDVEVGTGAIPPGTHTLFALAGVGIFVLTLLAVIGMERRAAPLSATPMPEQRVAFTTVVRESARMPQARLFFGFMIASTLFFFIQQAIVQPFGGDVFGMSVGSASGLTAMVTLGTIVGMIVAGRPFAVQVGHKRVARWGLIFSVIAFTGLAIAAGTVSGPGVWLTLLFVGLGLGIFNVASLALMMSMVTRARAAFFMGAWTVAHAFADGASTAGGGVVFSAANWLTGSEAAGYAIVFALEAVGLALCLPLLRRVDPERFVAEASSVSSDVTPVVPGGTPAGVAAFSAVEPRARG